LKKGLQILICEPFFFKIFPLTARSAFIFEIFNLIFPCIIPLAYLAMIILSKLSLIYYLCV
jgi:hypothetical protein